MLRLYCALRRVGGLFSGVGFFGGGPVFGVVKDVVVYSQVFVFIADYMIVKPWLPGERESQPVGVPGNGRFI